MSAAVAFLDELFEQGVLYDTGIDGLAGKSALFEDLVGRLSALMSRLGAADDAEIIRFPPGMARSDFEATGYLKSFPQLAGTVHSFNGNDAGHQRLIEEQQRGEDWTGQQVATDVVLTPAVCYPVYPLVAKRGNLPEEGLLFDLCGYCFRREPSKDPVRMQMFRQHEYVRVGSPDQVIAFREMWISRATEVMTSLGLPFTIDIANDPFFGRAGRFLASSQRDQKLKFELLVPIHGPDKLTACISFNYHQDHFGCDCGIRQAGGDFAHTACVGMGLERVAIALLKFHGFDPLKWPTSVRAVLWG